MANKVKISYVKLWNKTMGAVSWNESNKFGTFAYDSGFLNGNLDPAPLIMPLDKARRMNEPIFTFRDLPFITFHGLPGMLSDSLPDSFGNNVINSWLARQGRTPEDFSPIERLCYTGKRGMGALEFEPVLNKYIEKSVPVEISELLNLAQEVINERNKLNTSLKKKDALTNILRVGTSAGGTRPKAVIAFNDKTNELRSGQVKAPKGFSYWILKFDGVKDDTLGDPEGFSNIEYAYSKMVKDSGIDMTECRLIEDQNRYHFMTKRFDRKDDEKLHSQTLCALAHFNYKAKMEYSYEQAFWVSRELKLPYKDIEQLFKRMVFNVIARNQDDHTKNISFLMDKKGIWRISPAYDMTYAYNPIGKWTNIHQMSINGKTDNITIKDINTVGIANGIKSYKQIIEQITTSVSRWPEFAKDADVKKSFISEISKHQRLNINRRPSFSFSI